MCTQVIWKRLYNHSSARDGTLVFFQSKLNRITVTKDVKKGCKCYAWFPIDSGQGPSASSSMQDSWDKKTWLKHTASSTCKKWPDCDKNTYVRSIATQIVELCTLIGGAFTDETVSDTQDAKYNYVRVLCHYGVLVMGWRRWWMGFPLLEVIFAPFSCIWENKVFTTSLTPTASNQMYVVPSVSTWSDVAQICKQKGRLREKYTLWLI